MNITIVEVSRSHEECIYSQVLFLTSAGHKVSLLLHEALEPQVATYWHLCEQLSLIRPVAQGLLPKWQQQRKTAKILEKQDVVIFNTASSSKFVRNLCLLLLHKQVLCLGVLHHGNKLMGSFTQKVISLKIKRYYVLSDHIKKQLTPKQDTYITSFYPIFFPDNHQYMEKPPNEIWISIPGRIDATRRDYDTLLKTLAKTQRKSKLKFLLLGKLDRERITDNNLMEQIEKLGLQDFFICFDHFIPNKEYHAYLKSSNLVMPLLKEEENYLRYKISGSFNLAYAYQKPLLCKQFFATIGDLNENAIFYTADNLAQVLEGIGEGSLDVPNGYQNPKWEFNRQKEQYLSLLKV
ncbi:Hypothetical protein I595_2107 [Croceitalea dokdonensis DOKDO 023]|uniref:Uncharacterized protein n=1 Tax=Croceitalea dokdonensis DOKDO 023 TaxID=1300341 RepID=A0A0P7AIK1_9FLAO|nr:hypothetical protein [Croceitalea dokdonensis]KPM31613.1 Hypothetical protein I595_2107 [Croceitalea dokdonensis DOKDO 023]